MDFQEIPGMTSPVQLDLVSRLCYNVPENGWIVEIGCYCGRQSLVIGRSKKDSILLSCIDYFPNEDYDDWKEYTSYLKNVEAVKTKSPLGLSNVMFSKLINLLIIDLNDIYDNLIYWHKFVEINGCIVVHTYEYEDLFQEVDKFLKNHTNFSHNDLGYTSILTRIK